MTLDLLVRSQCHEDTASLIGLRVWSRRSHSGCCVSIWWTVDGFNHHKNAASLVGYTSSLQPTHPSQLIITSQSPRPQGHPPGNVFLEVCKLEVTIPMLFFSSLVASWRKAPMLSRHPTRCFGLSLTSQRCCDLMTVSIMASPHPEGHLWEHIDVIHLTPYHSFYFALFTLVAPKTGAKPPTFRSAPN